MTYPVGGLCPYLYTLKEQSYKQSILFRTIYSCSLTVYANQCRLPHVFILWARPPLMVQPMYHSLVPKGISPTASPRAPFICLAPLPPLSPPSHRPTLSPPPLSPSLSPRSVNRGERSLPAAELATLPPPPRDATRRRARRPVRARLPQLKDAPRPGEESAAKSELASLPVAEGRAAARRGGLVLASPARSLPSLCISLPFLSQSIRRRCFSLFAAFSMEP